MPLFLPKGSFHWGNQQRKACLLWAMQHTVELKYRSVSQKKSLEFTCRHAFKSVKKKTQTNIISAFVLLTLFHVAVGEFCALHTQVDLLHCDLQPAERAVQPSHQQALDNRSALTAGCGIQTRAEGLSPAKGSDPRHLSLLMTVRP